MQYICCVYMKNQTKSKKELRKTYAFTLTPSIKTKGDKLAFACNKSLSRFLEDLIEEAHNRKFEARA